MRYTDRVKCWKVEAKGGVYTVELESTSTGRYGRAEYGAGKLGQHGPIIQITTNLALGFEEGKEYVLTIASVE